MHIASLIFSPAFLGMISLLAAIVWMLMDEKDKTRPLVVFAIIINLFYGTVLTIVLGREGSLLPWKYDLVLLQIDKALGFSEATIALPLVRGFWRIPLYIVYQSLVPVMIVCYFMQRRVEARGMVIRGYMTELVTGPIFYAILPACGPIYAFGATWLHPAMEPAQTIRLSGMPNAFPSLHVATAFLLVLFARRVFWRVAALVYLLGTILSTLSTGEHFVVDLIAGLAFGCFAGSVAYRRWRSAFVYLLTVGLWSVAIRFGYEVLLSHPYVLRSFALITVLIAVHAVLVAWEPLPASTEAPLSFDEVENVPQEAGLSRES
jgi:membrane-associated phospholipid phosphatase